VIKTAISISLNIL